MNTTNTTDPSPLTAEDLDALSMSTDMLRRVIQQASRTDKLDKMVEQLTKTISRQDQVIGNVAHALGSSSVEDLAGQITRMREDLVIAKAKNHALANTIERMDRDIETLARQVPPPPLSAPSTSVFDGPKGVEMYALKGANVSIRECVGQQWCRTDTPLHGNVNLWVATARWLTLCNVYRDAATGALVFEPVSPNELPHT